jgi:uncharacterized delta-60 repeat protein
MKKFTRSVLPGLLVFGLVVWVKSAWAAAGSLDPTFGRGGVTITNFASQGDVIPYSIKLQTDGKILVLVVAGEITDPSSGAAAFGVQRLNTNGTADTSFGSGGLGIASMGFPGTQAVLLIQPTTGNILLGAQLEPTGRGQPFRFTGTGGTAVEDVPNGIAVQANGDIVVVGLHSTPSTTVNALARLTPSGSFDSGFGTGGIVTNSVPADTGGLELP